MKSLKFLTVTAVVALTSVALTSVFAEADAPKARSGGHGDRMAMDHLLPPRLITDLKLTADQQTKYTELEASFKKDSTAWAEKNPPPSKEEMEKARDGDKAAREAMRAKRAPLMEMRKGYVDKFVASLTPEQKTQFDKAMQEMRDRMKGSGPRGGKTDKDAKPAPPAE